MPRPEPVSPPALRRALTLVLALGLLGWLPAARASEIAFTEQSLELPGAPAALVPTDLDGDGVQDLAVVVVYTAWDQVGRSEWTEMDQVEGLVEVLTIVPVLFDRREVRAFLGRPEGGFRAAGEPLELPLSVLALEPGPPGVPAVALTDAGASALRFDAAAGSLVLEPLVDDPPVVAGTETFFSDLSLLHDVTGDGVDDLLLPTDDALAVYPGTGSGLGAAPVTRVPVPRDARGRRVEYPLPRVEDLDGDGRLDLLFRVARRSGGTRLVARRNLGGGRFGDPVTVEETGGENVDDAPDAAAAEAVPQERELSHVGRLRPEGPAVAVYLESLDEESDKLREEMRQAREPSYRVHLTPLAPSLRVDEAAPPAAPPSEVTGYLLDDSSSDLPLPGGIQDLDGDGLRDLVTVTNDISMMKAMAVLATRRLTLDLAFHTWCQQPDGRFVRAPGVPLTSKLKIHLNDLEIRRRSLFAGDFDGDGRADFLQLGRSREIGIHRGRADCSYPERPDVTVALRDEIRDLALVEARDLDGDGRSDLAVTHPRPVDDRGVTAPVRLDLYLTGNGEGR